MSVNAQLVKHHYHSVKSHITRPFDIFKQSSFSQFIKRNIKKLSKNNEYKTLERMNYRKYNIAVMHYKFMIQALFDVHRVKSKRLYCLKHDWKKLLSSFIEELYSPPRKAFDDYYYIKFFNNQYIIRLDSSNEYTIKRVKDLKTYTIQRHEGTYYTIDINKKTYTLHYIICSTFKINLFPDDFVCIDHANRNIHDNSIANLHWQPVYINNINSSKYEIFSITDDDLKNYTKLNCTSTFSDYDISPKNAQYDIYYSHNITRDLYALVYPNEIIKLKNKKCV